MTNGARIFCIQIGSNFPFTVMIIHGKHQFRVPDTLTIYIWYVNGNHAPTASTNGYL